MEAAGRVRPALRRPALILTTMETLNPAEEWRRLAEHYRQISDSELLLLAQRDSELTDVAQQALAQEMHHRRLKLEPEEPVAPPIPAPEPDDSPYAEDRELIEICTVWSLRDALQLQRLLDTAGIPFFMGPEKATGVDAVTSNFVEGLSVKIMRIGLPWVREPMQNYAPLDEPKPVQQPELGDALVRCPKCNSTDVIFERLIPNPETAIDNAAAQFEWICDACGHRWNDDGIAEIQ